MAPLPTRHPDQWRMRPIEKQTDGLGFTEFHLADQDRWIPCQHLRYSERDAFYLLLPNGKPCAQWQDTLAMMVRHNPETDGSVPEVPVPESIRPGAESIPEDDEPSDPIATVLGSVEKAMREAMKPALDADQVRDMIRAELRDMPAPVVQVVLPDLDPIEVEGTQHHLFEKMLGAVNARLNVFLTGAPGTGKTTLCAQVAKGLGIEFRHLSCHPQMTGVSLFGYCDAKGDYVRTDFRDAYEHGYLFLLDEADNGNGGIIAALNAAIENGSCSFPDGMVKRHPDFRIAIAANTLGTGATADFAGRNKLDPATLNRFVYLHVGIDEAVEEAMVLAEADPADSKSTEQAIAWLAKVRQCRANEEAAQMRPRVFITPRDARDGARLIRLGWTAKEAAEAKFLASCDDTARAKILAGVKF